MLPMEKVCEPGVSENMKHRQIVVAGLKQNSGKASRTVICIQNTFPATLFCDFR